MYTMKNRFIGSKLLSSGTLHFRQYLDELCCLDSILNVEEAITPCEPNYKTISTMASRKRINGWVLRMQNARTMKSTQ